MKAREAVVPQSRQRVWWDQSPGRVVSDTRRATVCKGFLLFIVGLNVALLWPITPISQQSQIITGSYPPQKKVT